MKIASTELKKDLKQLSPVRSEYFQIGEHGIAAQDPDVWITIQNRLSELGEPFSVHGRKFSATVNRMSGEIELTREENKLTLRSARAKVDLEIQNIKSLLFPKPASGAVAFDIQEFKKLLGLVAPCVDTKRSTAFGQGLLLDTLPVAIEPEESPTYRVTGSDGMILATVRSTAKVSRQFRWILNSASAAFVQLMDSGVEIGEGENGLQIKSGNSLCFLSRPNKEYPNIDKILPASSEFVAKFRPEDWVKPLHLLDPLIESIQTKDGQIPVVSCKFSGNMVLFTSIGTGSQAQDEAPYEQLEPDPVFDPTELALRLNAKHLSTFLSKATSEATINVTKDTPVLFTSGALRVLTMPVGGK